MGFFKNISKITGGDLLSAGVSLFAGDKSAKAAKKQTDLSKKQFDLVRTQSIQDRVADARKAGIHPLYAIGASPSASPTIMAGQSDQGTYIAEAGRQLGAAYDKAQSQPLAAAQLRAINAAANRDEAAAMLDLSRAKREQQVANVRQDGALMAGEGVPPGRITALPSEIVSAQKGDASTVAGKKPAFMEVIVGADPKTGKVRTAYVPYSDEGPAEGLDSMGALGLSALKNLGIFDWPSENWYKGPLIRYLENLPRYKGRPRHKQRKKYKARPSRPTKDRRSARH